MRAESGISPRGSCRSPAVSATRKKIPKRVRYMVMKWCDFRCQLCGRTGLEAQLEIDHRIPVARGGTNEITNLWVLCRACNAGKSDDLGLAE